MFMEGFEIIDNNKILVYNGDGDGKLHKMLSEHC